eukprot:gene12051-biopygen1877
MWCGNVASRIWQDCNQIFPTPPEFCSLARKQLPRPSLVLVPGTGQVDSGIHVLGPWDGTSGYATSSPSRLITQSDFLRAAMVGCGRASAGLTRIYRVPCDGRSGFRWCQTPPTTPVTEGVLFCPSCSRRPVPDPLQTHLRVCVSASRS